MHGTCHGPRGSGGFGIGSLAARGGAWHSEHPGDPAVDLGVCEPEPGSARDGKWDWRSYLPDFLGSGSAHTIGLGITFYPVCLRNFGEQAE